MEKSPAFSAVFFGGTQKPQERLQSDVVEIVMQIVKMVVVLAWHLGGLKGCCCCCCCTVDGKHPANQLICIDMLLFTGVHTCQVVVWDFWTINSMFYVLVLGSVYQFSQMFSSQIMMWRFRQKISCQKAPSVWVFSGNPSISGTVFHLMIGTWSFFGGPTYLVSG